MILFDIQGGDVGGVLSRSPSEVGTMTPSEGFFGELSEVVVGVIVIMPGLFSCVTCWCVRGVVLIWYGVVGVVDVWLVVVGVGATLSAVVPKMFAICCDDSPCLPWKVWFSFLIF